MSTFQQRIKLTFTDPNLNFQAQGNYIGGDGLQIGALSLVSTREQRK